LDLGCISFADALKRQEPDWLIVLGDRFEVLACAIAAFNLQIPIAHISGGEITQGATDDAFRHCITKLSYLHFVYADDYAKRVTQLGEDPERVINVGCLTIEGIEKYKYDGPRQGVLVIYHPETLTDKIMQRGNVDILLAFLNSIDEPITFCMSHGDSGSRWINNEIKKFVLAHPEHTIRSYDRPEFLKALARTKCLIGNSSAGIYEAPVLDTPVINIGTRQDGRLQASIIYNSPYEYNNLIARYKLAILRGYQPNCTIVRYGASSVSEKILKEIKKCKTVNLQKGFYDIN
jgi:GDP/UDP-N,N'-diacetylbacillosamine 2-epimerase (hydrolysing)